MGKLGRLGNSLFQIAAITGIAKRLQREVQFPEWKYEPYFKNHLPHYNLPNPDTVNERQYHYDEDFINNLPDNVNLRGYFQSEKYWKDYEAEIRKLFEFNDAFKEKIKQRFTSALSGKTLAISVRRGDFVDNNNYYQIPVDYYLQAYYKYFGSDYNVIIFSDDMRYCKLHFSCLPNVYFAEGSDIDQLCLMSMCENHIVSNSTFSWWGAYLSGSKNVIRPIMVFGPSQPLDDSDYWINEWKVYEPVKYDLTNTTFIIPVFNDHRDRRHNLLLTVAFLLKHFNTNIIIGEQGGRAFEYFNDYSGVKYVQFTYEQWHRTKMINDMCKMAKTPITVNWDCDNMIAPAQIIEAVKAIEKGADIAYPFDGNVYRVHRHVFPQVAKTLDVDSIDLSKCRHTAHSSVGHCLLMNNKSFLKAGGENEKFISWGPEDSERYDRFNTLGLKVVRIKGAVFHMDHYVGPTSSGRHEHFRNNIREHNKVKEMKKAELEQYISTWHNE